jgi:5-methylcytosine-specific restriction endonuclease McrA
LPDITPENWEVDVLWSLGKGALDAIQQELADEDSGFAIGCKRCGRELAPWDGDALHVVTYHLEEHYGIPLNTPGRRNPPKKLRNQIIKLYGGVCFDCGKAGPGLHIDHILPQHADGDAAFRNLQPLCEACGQKKGDVLPDDVEVWSNMYFFLPPSDGYEGLFW